jgi:hypothetical protein
MKKVTILPHLTVSRLKTERWSFTKETNHLIEQDPDQHLSEKESWILNPNTHGSNADPQP